jgi:hypothetical protein
LALAKIFECPIGSLPVGITMRKALFASNDDDERILRRCDNSALLLATEFSVDVSSPIVDFAFFKTPAHTPPVG